MLSSSKFDLDATYPLSAFTRAQPVQAQGERRLDSAFGSKSPTEPRISGNVARINVNTDLPDTVREKTKIIIVQGIDPDDPGKSEHSRSHLVWQVTCELVKLNVSDDIIYSILTDPDLGISAHCRAQGAGMRRAAERAIRRAKEQAIDPHLRELNDRHAVVENAGGRCRIIEELFDPAFNRHVLTMQSFDDFRNRYSHKRVTCGLNSKGQPVEKPLGQWWLDQAARKQFRSIVFAPGQEIEGVYNMWRGFAVEPQPGTKHQRFMDHMRDDLCAGDPVVYDYLVNWMARAVQEPARQGEVAIVIRGKKGSGKGTFARAFGGLFGRHFWAVSDAKHIVGNFNAHLRDCIVLFGDEAFWAGDKKHESVLKALITEPSLVIEPKGVDSVIAPNYVHLIMASNEQWVVPASYDERRFLVLDVNPAHMGEAAYWDAINADLKNGALNNLLHELQTRDISNFNHRVVPKTEALVDQKIHSMDTDQEWWFRKLTDGTLLPAHAGWAAPVPKDALVDDYLTYAQKRGVGKRTSATQLARSIERWTPGLKAFQGQFKGRDLNGDPVIGTAMWWQFPELSICREAFGKQNGGPFVWKDIEVEAKSARPDPF